MQPGFLGRFLGWYTGMCFCVPVLLTASARGNSEAFLPCCDMSCNDGTHKSRSIRRAGTHAGTLSTAEPSVAGGSQCSWTLLPPVAKLWFACARSQDSIPAAANELHCPTPAVRHRAAPQHKRILTPRQAVPSSWCCPEVSHRLAWHMIAREELRMGEWMVDGSYAGK